MSIVLSIYNEITGICLRLKGYVSFINQPNAIYEFQYAYGLPELCNNWHAITINDCYYWLAFT